MMPRRPDRPRYRALTTLTPLGLALAACSGVQDPGPDGPAVAVSVAPLSLPGIGYACYDLLIQNDLEQTVWSSGTVSAEGASPSICSNQYGNAGGGDITYIAPCDATEADTADAGLAVNKVTLWVDGLYSAAGADIGEYQNPCPWPDGCSLSFDCEENADVAVAFNLTVMREAQQGFFDVAVNFQDVFCSGKVDCAYENDEPVMALFGADGERKPSVAVAFACTAGPEADVETYLYLDTVQIRCEDGAGGYTTVATANPSAGTGNIFPTPLGPDGEEVLWQYAVYRGQEASNNVLYWNLALGLDLSAAPAGVCYLDTSATASDGPLVGGATPADTTYPVMQFHVALNPNGTDTLACGQNPLNGGSGIPEGLVTPATPGVTTAYTAPGAPECFNGGLTMAIGTAEPTPVGFDAGCGVTFRVYGDLDLDGHYDPAVDFVSPDTIAYLQVYNENYSLRADEGHNGYPDGLVTYTKYENGAPFAAGLHHVGIRWPLYFNGLVCPDGSMGYAYGPFNFDLNMVQNGSYFMEIPYRCGGTVAMSDDVHGIQGRVFEDKDDDGTFSAGDVLTQGQRVVMYPRGALGTMPGLGLDYRYAEALSDSNGLALLSKYLAYGIGSPGQPILWDVEHEVRLTIGAPGSTVPPQCAHGAEWTGAPVVVEPPELGSDVFVDLPYRCLPAPAPTPAPPTFIQFHDANGNGAYDAGIDVLAGAGHGIYLKDAVNVLDTVLLSNASGAATLTSYTPPAGGVATPLRLTNNLNVTTGPLSAYPDLYGTHAGLVTQCPAGWVYAASDKPATAHNERFPSSGGIAVTATPLTMYLPSGCVPVVPKPGALRFVQYHDRNNNGQYEAGMDPIAGAGFPFSIGDPSIVGAHGDYLSDAQGAVVVLPASFNTHIYRTNPGALCPSGYVADPISTVSVPITAEGQTLYVKSGCGRQIIFYLHHDLDEVIPTITPGVDPVAGAGFPMRIRNWATTIVLSSDAEGKIVYRPTDHTFLIVESGYDNSFNCPSGTFRRLHDGTYRDLAPREFPGATFHAWTGCSINLTEPPTPGLITFTRFHDFNGNETYDAGVDPIAEAGFPMQFGIPPQPGGWYSDDEPLITLISDAAGNSTYQPLTFIRRTIRTASHLGAAYANPACPDGYVKQPGAGIKWEFLPGSKNTEPGTDPHHGWRVTQEPKTYYLWTGCKKTP